MAYIGSRFAFSLHGIHLWTTVLFHESIDKNMPRPTPQALLLTGILRALWDHQAAADEPKLIVHVYDMPLVRSIKSLPSTHSTVVLILLNELVQLNTDALVRSYSMGFLRPRWACTLPQGYGYAIEGIPPPEVAISCHTLSRTALIPSVCHPIEFLRDTWSWGDLF